MNFAAFIEWARKSLSPSQICWLCLLATVSLYTYTVRTYASNDEVKAINVKITENSLFDLRSKQCESIRRQQSGAAYRSKIQELLREYSLLTGSRYELPDCTEL
jgi:hypothetical protein